MKYLKSFLIAVFLFAGISAGAQDFSPVGGDKLQKIMSKIVSVSSSINTLGSDFKEVKDIAILSDKQISTGKMYYSRPSKIRWEYVSPNPYLFIVNDGQTVVKNGSKIERGNTGAAMVFKQIGKMILGCISGNKIVDEKQFSALYYTNGKIFKIVMTPRDRRMKQMMSSITFSFSTADYYIISIEMLGSTGDSTVITLNNKDINSKLNNSVFVL